MELLMFEFLMGLITGLIVGWIVGKCMGAVKGSKSSPDELFWHRDHSIYSDHSGMIRSRFENPNLKPLTTIPGVIDEPNEN
ncbi:MAG: hypothetical protein JW885_02645 [Deltaproteobacteria bacterium]|nr:hypothetical protein [Candidatus Zymogenaceae bacterium]